jgi:hypothetical protein
MIQWMMQHYQNHHFEMIHSPNGNLSLRQLEKIGALLSTSWKLEYKFPRWLVKLWMCWSEYWQQCYLVWHLPEVFKLRWWSYHTSLTDITEASSDFEFGRVAALWQAMSFCQKVVKRWSPNLFDTTTIAHPQISVK